MEYFKKQVPLVLLELPEAKNHWKNLLQVVEA